jgi:TetR/AcrR family transcriptional regulator, transcriptional repressor for nem operon
MRYEPDHKEQTRQRVLKVAARAIRAEGAHRVAVAKVMAKAGLTVGGFYAHFDSKDDLIAAAIEEMFAEAGSHLTQETDARSPAQALAVYIDFYLSPAHRDARATGCPMPSLAADLPRLTEKARQRFSAGVVGLRRRVADWLAVLGHADPEAEASSMIAELVGALSLARGEPDPAASDAILDRSKAALKRRFALEYRP